LNSANENQEAVNAWRIKKVAQIDTKKRLRLSGSYMRLGQEDRSGVAAAG
jgi:hypothetical protein